jgi:hypothetical protein
MRTVEDWNAALPDVLLFEREGENSVPILLSCDEVAVETRGDAAVGSG